MQKIITLSLIVLLAACAGDAPLPVKRDLPTGDALNLDVRSVSFADRSGPQPSDSPYNKNDFHPTITEAIRQWSTDRLKAVGASGDAMVIVKNATLSSSTLPHSNNMFKREQAFKYTAHAEVEIEIKGSQRGDYAVAMAEATRFETLPENPTPIERQNAYTTALNGLMQDLNRNLEASIRQHMGAFVITAPIINGSYGAVPPPVIQ